MKQLMAFSMTVCLTPALFGVTLMRFRIKFVMPWKVCTLYVMMTILTGRLRCVRQVGVFSVFFNRTYTFTREITGTVIVTVTANLTDLIV